VDWLVEASVSEKWAVCIFRAGTREGLYIQNVQILTLKILDVVSLTKNKTKSYDNMLFYAAVSYETFLNAKNVATSHF
jgi:hypothetical protein